MNPSERIAILGAGNIGTAIARGLSESGLFQEKDITLTRRHPERLEDFQKRGFSTTASNPQAVEDSEILILAVEPGQVNGLLQEIAPHLEPSRHTICSVVSGADISSILQVLGQEIAVIRAMPNTAIGIRESMTCLCAEDRQSKKAQLVENLFSALGHSLWIDEEQMGPATALCACGTAFFLRAIRAASQGGIEIGFHSEEALTMAAQTARGAAAILLSMQRHPEREIDRVTTPRGATISGLNEMEHQGFSSAMIRGITTSAEKVNRLYREEDA